MIVTETIFQKHKPLHLKAYHATAQESMENLCKSSEPSCSHFCTVTNDLITKCLCPRNQSLQGGNICVPELENSSSIESKDLSVKSSHQTGNSYLFVTVSIGVILTIIIVCQVG